MKGKAVAVEPVPGIPAERLQKLLAQCMAYQQLQVGLVAWLWPLSSFEILESAGLSLQCSLVRRSAAVVWLLDSCITTHVGLTLCALSCVQLGRPDCHTANCGCAGSHACPLAYLLPHTLPLSTCRQPSS